MYKILKIFLSLSLLSTVACANSMPKLKIIGNWIYTGNIEHNVKVECPDVLKFNDNGKYAILNDCYGDSVNSFFIEQGKWSFDNSSNEITLNQREFYTNYFFKEKINTLIINIQSISEEEMSLCFSEKNNCIEERYQYIKIH